MLNKYRGSHLIGAFILLQLIVCLPFINSFPIDLDEPFSIFHAQKDLSDLFVIFTQENNPPLHFILLHFWIKLFGISPLAVRSLSLIFSIITIPILYQFSKKIVKQPFAILVVFLYIFSTQIHYHSLEARTYSLLVLLTVAAFNQLFDFIFNDKANFFQLAVINALLLYTHYLSGYIILTQIIILLLFKRNYVRKKIIQAIISYILMTILYTPGIWIFMLRLKHFSSQGTWVPEAKLIELP
ncbi:MAG TPA: hypothetical protein EYG85_07830, partial [Crocinitomix sp.]|nr:hypothetical protein [Crocinitomix sp.]